MATLVSHQKKTGAFYTTGDIASFLARWAIRHPDDHVLEPSFGDGIFIDKAAERLNALGNSNPSISAVEIQKVSFTKYLDRKSANIVAYLDDFLNVKMPCCVDAIIGNPPYVSLKRLTNLQKTAALSVAANNGIKMPANGSSWLPFVLHGTSFLKKNGRLAYVLPFEITYARYAFDMWKYLGQNYSNIKVVRLYEDFFPEVDVETVLLLADGRGGNTDCVQYQVFESIADLANQYRPISKMIPLQDIVENKKPFISAILTHKQSQLLRHLHDENIIMPILDVCKFKIGYVSADKHFFHPSGDARKLFGLSDNNFIPSIINAKEINGGTSVGIHVIPGQCHSRLYLPRNVAESDRAYIERGEANGVSEKYKCRQRKPWFITPNVEIPDVILTVFGETPKLIINSGGYAASNSLLCGTLKGITGAQLISQWYNSITLLSLELTAHSLGGGSFVIIPGEADSLDILRPFSQTFVDLVCDRINDCIIRYGLPAAYNLGDQIVLSEILGLSENEIKIIRECMVYNDVNQ